MSHTTASEQALPYLTPPQKFVPLPLFLLSPTLSSSLSLIHLIPSFSLILPFIIPIYHLHQSNIDTGDVHSAYRYRTSFLSLARDLIAAPPCSRGPAISRQQPLNPNILHHRNR